MIQDFSGRIYDGSIDRELAPADEIARQGALDRVIEDERNRAQTAFALRKHVFVSVFLLIGG